MKNFIKTCGVDLNHDDLIKRYIEKLIQEHYIKNLHHSFYKKIHNYSFQTIIEDIKEFIYCPQTYSGILNKKFLKKYKKELFQYHFGFFIKRYFFYKNYKVFIDNIFNDINYYRNSKLNKIFNSNLISNKYLLYDNLINITENRYNNFFEFMTENKCKNLILKKAIILLETQLNNSSFGYSKFRVYNFPSKNVTYVSSKKIKCSIPCFLKH